MQQNKWTNKAIISAQLVFLVNFHYFCNNSLHKAYWHDFNSWLYIYFTVFNGNLLLVGFYKEMHASWHNYRYFLGEVTGHLAAPFHMCLNAEEPNLQAPAQNIIMNILKFEQKVQIFSNSLNTIQSHQTRSDDLTLGVILQRCVWTACWDTGPGLTYCKCLWKNLQMLLLSPPLCRRWKLELASSTKFHLATL